MFCTPPSSSPTMAVLDDIEVDYDLEYLTKKDAAWFTCAVVLEDQNHLRVKFEGFAQTCHDEVFSVADFNTHSDIEQLIHKFRPVSKPVEDNECSILVQGMLVCAIYRRHDEVLYYDAVVDAVLYVEHTPEKCVCSYLLCWQHGPGEGTLTEASIEDICFIVHGDIHPKIAEFSNLVKQQLSVPSVESQVFDSVEQSSHVGLCAGRERFCTELSDHDRDLGGVKKTDPHHYIVLTNLDKDSCPLSMMDFIHEHTSITAQTCVLPSLSLETYARGAIMVDSETKLKRICDFINNPNHFIISFSGRPWVIAEDGLRSGVFNTNLRSLQPKYESYSRKNELKIVRSGTEEFRKAKELKDLFMAFHNHQNGLMQRLAMEENKNRIRLLNC